MHASILLLPGDGIGPEVVAAAASVLRAVASRFNHQFDLHDALIGGAALRRDLAPLPAETLAAARAANAILLGAVGDPADVKTVAPALANCIAAARPMPEAQPVMTTVLPVRSVTWRQLVLLVVSFIVSFPGS